MAQKEFKNYKISIILPNYNSSKYISSTIKSVINQSYKHWELIIVDDCSNKQTLTKLLKFSKNKKIKIIFLKKNKGSAFCRNLAIQKSRSEYLAFIDSDDLWEKNKLKDQLLFMIKNKYKFTYTDYKTFKDEGKKFKKVSTPNKLNFEDFIKDTSIATSCMMVNRATAKNIKFTNTKICEDYYFKCRILKKIEYAYSLKKYLTKYRIRKNSLQSNRIKNFYWIWKINKNFNKLSFVKNISSLFFISLSSIKRYGLK